LCRPISPALFWDSSDSSSPQAISIHLKGVTYSFNLAADQGLAVAQSNDELGSTNVEVLELI
jgi:hypothetical protein